MEDTSFIPSDSTHCIKLYNEYLEVIRDIGQQLEVIQQKAIKAEKLSDTLRQLRPSDMIYTTMWKHVKTTITLTNNATKQIAPKLLTAIQAVAKTKEAANKIKEATGLLPQQMLRCGSCKMKKEPTEENMINLFGTNPTGKPFVTCIKCRASNQKHKQDKRCRPTDDDDRICTSCLKVKSTDEFIANGKKFKACSQCRKKTTQKLINLKEQMAGGATKVCERCSIDKAVCNFVMLHEENVLHANCNQCLTEINAISPAARIARQAILRLENPAVEMLHKRK
jgi:hypothetical protein